MNQATRWKRFLEWADGLELADFDSKEDLFFSLLLKIREIRRGK